jgi:hypothetical protein
MASPADREDRTFYILFNRISRTFVNWKNVCSCLGTFGHYWHYMPFLR